MKKLIQLLACALFVAVASSCSQGAAAIDKAFEQACEAQPCEKVATTLCNGNIKCSTLTSEQAAKLGAVLGYITYTGMYSANFEDQVDIHQFGDLLNQYREIERTQTSQDRKLVEEYTRQILTTLPLPAPGQTPPPPAPAAGELPPPPAPEGAPAPAE